jgi:hypothetical protein
LPVTLLLHGTNTKKSKQNNQNTIKQDRYIKQPCINQDIIIRYIVSTCHKAGTVKVYQLLVIKEYNIMKKDFPICKNS